MALLAGIVAATVSHREASAQPGHLALLLSADRSGVVAAHVAPSSRDELTATRLGVVWSAAVGDVGGLREVRAHYVVRETGGSQDELEVLRFSRGGGVLTAHRTPAGITGIVLLVGHGGDQEQVPEAAAYATDLVTGRLPLVRARFNVQMSQALPAELFAAETAAATAGLQPPASVVGQIVVRRAGLTVLETYLLFRNGLRRIEMTLEPNGSIAGLYIRML